MREINEEIVVEEEQNKSENRENEKKKEVAIKPPPVKTLPHPLKPSKKDKERQFARFLNIFKRLQTNIPFLEALEQMSTYAKFMKEILTKKRIFIEEETIVLEVGCSVIIQKRLPPKFKDLGGFRLLVIIGSITVGKPDESLYSSIPLAFMYPLES